MSRYARFEHLRVDGPDDAGVAEPAPTAREVAREPAAGAPTAIRWTKQSLNNWYRQVAGAIFDASLALEFYGFGGPESARARPHNSNTAVPICE